METVVWKHWIASLTDSCDNRCPGCYRVLGDNLSWSEKHMSMPDFTKILKIFSGQGGDTVDFVGGEPTLNPDFLTMAQLCMEKGLEVWIYTNLREFARNPNLAKELQALGDKLKVVGKLNVPDPTNPEQRKLQAGFIGASLEAVDEMWQGLLVLLETGFPQGSIGVENLLRRTNIVWAPSVYETGLRMGFFVDLEVPTCPFITGLKSFRQWLALFPTKTQILSCIRQVAEINERWGIPPYTPMMPHLTGRDAKGIGTGCTCFKQAGLLTEADGRVALCTSGIPLLDEHGRQLNILQDPLEAIFGHPSLLARRASCQQMNIASDGPCASCQFWSQCMGGCAALRETLGRTSHSYPRCHLHEWDSDDALLALYQQTHGALTTNADLGERMFGDAHDSRESSHFPGHD